VDDFLLKLLNGLGVPGLITFLVYKLFNSWIEKLLELGGRYLEVNRTQATAFAEMAIAVKESRDEQKDVILAVRVLTAKFDENTGWLREMSQQQPQVKAIRGEEPKGDPA
jgi:hypothetical protein